MPSEIGILGKRCPKSAIEALETGLRTVRPKAGQMVRTSASRRAAHSCGSYVSMCPRHSACESGAPVNIQMRSLDGDRHPERVLGTVPMQGCGLDSASARVSTSGSAPSSGAKDVAVDHVVRIPLYSVAVDLAWWSTFKEPISATTEGRDAWTHTPLRERTAGSTDHLSGFGAHGAEARFYRANCTF